MSNDKYGMRDEIVCEQQNGWLVSAVAVLAVLSPSSGRYTCAALGRNLGDMYISTLL